MTQSTDPRTNILELVNSTIELPTMPEVLAKLNEVIAKPDASAADVALVVANDPAVATNMLRIVNSAYYGLQVRVSSVSLAVSVLGFWKHAVFTGVAARALASVSDTFKDMHSEDVYIAGLLHDIGKLILMEKA